MFQIARNIGFTPTVFLYPEGIFKFIFKPTENTVSSLQILTYLRYLEK
jgi:hypothetical protein